MSRPGTGALQERTLDRSPLGPSSPGPPPGLADQLVPAPAPPRTPNGALVADGATAGGTASALALRLPTLGALSALPVPGAERAAAPLQ
eukprot:7204618-Lingulodinium_polyedra.AAC.1